MIPLIALWLVGVLCSVSSSAQEIVVVRFGYFTEARPYQVACGRRWFDLHTPTRIYKVECYPQTSGTYAASRLDNLQLDISGLGSTPVAQAIARGIDVKVIYVGHDKGESAGIYVRASSDDYVGIKHPWELGGRTIGVPFGSTSHYQILFLLNYLGLTESVTLKDLSPDRIIRAWNNKSIDGAACWGAARDHILEPSTVPKGRQLLSAQTISDWGAGITTDIVVTRTFASEHGDFVDYFIGVLSRLTDSYIDRFGFIDPKNVERWKAANVNSSFVPSVVDTLMLSGEIPRKPSDEALFEQLQNLALFVQDTAREQISCNVIGRGPQTPCSTPTPHLILVRQSAIFLLEQKILGELGPLDFPDDADCSDGLTLCGSDVLDGSHVLRGRRECSNCQTVGPYSRDLIRPASSSLDGANDKLLESLEDADIEFNASRFAAEEVGRKGGDSTCSSTHTVVYNSSGTIAGSFGDGANATAGKSYSEDLNCRWVVRSTDCDDALSDCQGIVELQVSAIRIWPEDFVRIYEHTDMGCDPDSGVLLAQLSHVDDPLPFFRAKGCISVTFETDGQQERVYAGNTGDGFVIEFNRDANGCASVDCSRRGICVDGLCQCDEDSWGGDCSYGSHCLGTKRVRLAGSQPKMIKSAAGIERQLPMESMTPRGRPLDPSIAYPNDLNCTFVFEATTAGSKYVVVDIIYDVEPGFDTIRLESGFGETAVPYVVLSDQSSGFERYYVEVDSSGLASLQFKTDSHGRRLGFHATVWEVSEPRLEDGEFKYCMARNKLSPAIGKGTLGRVISQQRNETVRPMPWAPEGGCVWELSKDVLPSNIGVIVGIRLMFNSPLDFESFPAEAVGDKVVIGLGGDNKTLFKEQCKEDTDCSRPWQTEVCHSDGCEVRRVYEIEITDLSEPGFIAIITDENDIGKNHRGLPDVELIAVQQCPRRETHCLSLGGECPDGYCICKDGYACACSCNDDPPQRSFRDIMFWVIGVSAVVVVVTIGIFWLYRHRTKKMIMDQGDELARLKNTVVALRCSTKDYVPKTSPSVPHSSSSPEVVWCWKETPGCMVAHSDSDIYGEADECWIKYDETAIRQLEEAYQQGNTATVTVEGQITQYSVDVQTMTQTNQDTSFQREVARFEQPQRNHHENTTEHKQSEVPRDQVLPSDLLDEPQMVLVTGDIIQISKQRNDDGWAFGTKLHHADEDKARRLAVLASVDYSDELYTDTGWFPLAVTRPPSGDDLRDLQQQIGDSGSLRAPSYWKPLGQGEDPTVAQRHVLAWGDNEFKEVEAAFMSTLLPPRFTKRVAVQSIERIQNLALWQSYMVKRQTICYRDTSISPSPSELRAAEKRVERWWLWHATEAGSIKKIVQQGFNRSFCGRNNTLYGRGVYFARDSSFSARATYAVPDSNGLRYMLACRVVVGEYCLGTRDALTPRVRDRQKNILFDSTVDDETDPSIYVTYNDAQAYPEYLVVFQTLDGGAMA